jgi:hypothetical protein
MTTYAATKAFVLSFSEALWAENRNRNLRVVCLCPGGTRTNFDASLAAPRGRFEQTPMSSADEVARAGLNALDRNASFVVVGRANYAGALLTRLVPRSAIARTAEHLFRPLEPKNAAENKSAALLPLVGAGAALALLTGALLVARRKGRDV